MITSIAESIWRWFSNPPVRLLTKLAATRCWSCGSKLLETCYDLMAFERSECPSCRSLAAILASASKIVCSEINLSYEWLVELLKKRAWARRAVSRIVEGGAAVSAKPIASSVPLIVSVELGSPGGAREGVVASLAKAGVAMIELAAKENFDIAEAARCAEEASAAGALTVLSLEGGIGRADAKKLAEAGVAAIELEVPGGDASRAARSLAAASDAGLEAGISVAVTREVSSGIYGTIEEAKRLGAAWVSVREFIPQGVADADRDIDAKKRDEVLKCLLSETLRFAAGRGGFEVVAEYPQAASVVSEYLFALFGSSALDDAFRLSDVILLRSLASAVGGGCPAAFTIAAVSEGGDIYPCPELKLSAGNVSEEGFERVWRDSPLLRRLRRRSLIRGICGGCTYLYVCGGCRARAYAYFGDPLASDVACPYSEVRIADLAPCCPKPVE